MNKRLRYEVLRRDDYTCRYCGGRAPDVRLTVDHVVPVALGGTDDPSNLVAACSDCNSGKSSTMPGCDLVAQADENAARWASSLQAAKEIQAARLRDLDIYGHDIVHLWAQWQDQYGEYVYLPAGRNVEHYYDAGADLADWQYAIDVAMTAHFAEDRWAYTCGVVNRILNDRHEIARTVSSA